MQNSGKVFEF